MEELVKYKLEKSEESLTVFKEFLADKSHPIEDRKAVEFAYLFELFTFAALHDLMPAYVPTKSTQIQIAQGLGGARGYIKVVDGKVKIAPEYYSFLKMAQEFKNKSQGNGKLDTPPR